VWDGAWSPHRQDIFGPRGTGLLWTPSYWAHSDGAYVLYDGYWAPEVGFYGGIDYGFGYTGYGYEGGYWNDRAFFYNTAVNNITKSRSRTCITSPLLTGTGPGSATTEALGECARGQPRRSSQPRGNATFRQRLNKDAMWLPRREIQRWRCHKTTAIWSRSHISCCSLQRAGSGSSPSG
jgi:hypothetical protein